MERYRRTYGQPTERHDSLAVKLSTHAFQSRTSAAADRAQHKIGGD